MGRLDFKSSLRRSDPAVGEFDSHTPPPKKHENTGTLVDEVPVFIIIPTFTSVMSQRLF